jgi:hypothetical protein
MTDIKTRPFFAATRGTRRKRSFGCFQGKWKMACKKMNNARVIPVYRESWGKPPSALNPKNRAAQAAYDMARVRRGVRRACEESHKIQGVQDVTSGKT